MKESDVATVEQIMTSSVVTVDPGQTLRDALEILRAEEISGAPAAAGDEVVGVLSATDILEFQATSPGVPVTRPEESSAVSEPPLDWQEGDEMPSTYFVDYWAGYGADVTSRFDQVEGPEWDLLDDHLVSEVMTRKVVSVPPSATVREAAERMVSARVHRLLVLDSGTLRGIVTTTDVVRCVADGTV